MSDNNITDNNHNKHPSPPMGGITTHVKPSIKQEMSSSGKVNMYNSLISHTGAQESGQVHLNTQVAANGVMSIHHQYSSVQHPPTSGQKYQQRIPYQEQDLIQNNGEIWISKNSLNLSPVKPPRSEVNRNQAPTNTFEEQKGANSTHKLGKILLTDQQHHIGGSGSTDRQHHTQSQNEELEHLIFDFEEVECKMTDIEEKDQSNSSSQRSDTAAALAGIMHDAEGRSVRGSIINSPKNYNQHVPTRMSDMSLMSSINLTHNQISYMQNQQQQNQQYYSGKFNHLQDLLRYDAERHLDLSMTSMYSTPRNQNRGLDGFAGAAGMVDDSQLDLLSHSGFNNHTSGGIYSPNQHQRLINHEGRVNSQMDPMGMTPRLHKQDSVSSHRVMNDSFSFTRGGNKPYYPGGQHMLPSERSSIAMQRSSAEQSEIDRELNRHKGRGNLPHSVASSLDKNFYDPEIQKKRQLEAMQTQLQSLINKINDKEKLYKEQELLYTQLEFYLQKIEVRTQKLEDELKQENNLNSNLRTQINFVLQTNFSKGPGALLIQKQQNKQRSLYNNKQSAVK